MGYTNSSPQAEEQLPPLLDLTATPQVKILRQNGLQDINYLQDLPKDPLTCVCVDSHTLCSSSSKIMLTQPTPFSSSNPFFLFRLLSPCQFYSSLYPFAAGLQQISLPARRLRTTEIVFFLGSIELAGSFFPPKRLSSPCKRG